MKLSEKSTKELRKMSFAEIFKQMKLESPKLFQGDWIENLASRFIDELPKENVEKKNVTEKDFDNFEFNVILTFKFNSL